MISKLMTEINQKIEKLNKLLEDEEYFRNLEIVIDRQNKYNQELSKKLQQKENIIKEVREYIEKENIKRFGNPTIEMALSIRKDKLLEILNKVGDEK